MRNFLPFIFISFSIFISNLSAGDFTAINLKYVADYNWKDSYINGAGSYFEIETIAQRGDFHFYGFTDLRYMNAKFNQLNYDFYKYILKYDLINSNEKLFINAQIKETYGFRSDMFVGVGTSFDIPLFGKLYGNIYYFINGNDFNDLKSKLPLSIAFNWFNILVNDVVTGWDLAHGGWSDIDLYTQVKGSSQSRASWQIYEGISLQHKDYAVELGYKYWLMDSENKTSHSLFLAFVKKF